ncbi:MAG: septation protein SepH [Sporichthyaceae bacterium]
MQELRLVAANERGTHLVLRSTDGDKFLLCIDERLKAAARGDRSRFGTGEGESGTDIRPREIQARIRSGASAEQVARSAGVPVDRVRRFEGPVLAEREHIARQAQKSTVRRSGVDLRPAALLDVLAERLSGLGVDVAELGWDSWRRDDGRWVVQVAYSLDDVTTVARYLYDPKARSVLAEDDEARWLTGELDRRPVTGPFVPRVAAQLPEPEIVAPAVPEVAAPQGEIPAVDSGQQLAPAEIAAAMRSAAAAAPAEPVVPRRTPEGLPRPYGPRRPTPVPRRAVQMEVPLPEQPEPVVVATPPAPPAPEPVEAEPARTGTDNEPARPARGRRASVPAWDDIMFGARRTD